MAESIGLYTNPVLSHFQNVIIPPAGNGYPTETRVVCLYRVSTDKQLYFTDGNHVDIPMQRIRCREYSITFSRQFDELLDWAMKYPHCTINAKHMILSNLIVRIDIYRDYYFHIKLADNVMQLYRNITE